MLVRKMLHFRTALRSTPAPFRILVMLSRAARFRGRTGAHERDEDMEMRYRKTHSLRLDTTRDELELAVNANAAGDVYRLSGDDGLGCSPVLSSPLSPQHLKQ